MLYEGAWGKMIHEINLKQKSFDTVPLSGAKSYLNGDGDTTKKIILVRTSKR
jgi:hypothetical protein